MTRCYGVIYNGHDEGVKVLWDCLEHCGRDGILWAGGGIAGQDNLQDLFSRKRRKYMLRKEERKHFHAQFAYLFIKEGCKVIINQGGRWVSRQRVEKWREKNVWHFEGSDADASSFFLRLAILAAATSDEHWQKRGDSMRGEQYQVVISSIFSASLICLQNTSDS